MQKIHKKNSVNSFTNKLRLRVAVVNAVAVRMRSATSFIACTLSEKGPSFYSGQDLQKYIDKNFLQPT